MNTSARLTAVKWLIKTCDMGVSRFPDAETQAEIIQEKLKYQQELKRLEAAPKQLVLANVVPDDDEHPAAVNFSLNKKEGQ